MRQSVFESEAVSVFKMPGRREDVVFVSFESMIPTRRPDRRGFGEQFFHNRGFTAYHVMPRANEWYHYPEMEAALAAVCADIPEGTRVITYGMSMGAYAAYRFSAPLAADAVIAFSPQYSVDRWRVWWERRWSSEGKSLIWDRQLPRKEAVKYVFYDPLNQDRRHIRSLRKEAELELVRIYFSGHASIAYVQECGMLESAVFDIAENRFDIAAFEARLWQQRKTSATYQKMRRRKKTGIFRRLRYVVIEHLLDRRLGAAAHAPVPLMPDQGAA